MPLVCPHLTTVLSLSVSITDVGDSVNLFKSQNNDKEDSLLDGFHQIVMTVDTIHYSHQFLEVLILV